MDQLPINELINFAKQIFTAGLIGSTRLLGISLFFPLFTWTNLQGLLRNGIVVALSVPNIALIYFSMKGNASISILETTMLMGKEVMIGGAIGILLGLPFWAAQAAGDVVDTFRGASAANLLDPVNANEVSISGTFLVIYCLALFTLLGGIPMLLDILMQSFAVWPSQSLIPPHLNLEALAQFGGLGMKALMLSLVLAAPILVSLALADIAIIFAVRSGRSFPIYDLTFTIHNFVFIIMLPLYGMLFAQHFPGILRGMFDSVKMILPNIVH